MPTPPSFRATSVQVCGLWPFSGGAARPMVGVPVGQDLEYGSTICCDPINWFRAGYSANPSMMIYGNPGLGKSAFTVRQILGLAFQGVRPLILGDLKPDYPDVIRALGGQVMRFGEGQRLNVLDQGAMLQASDRIGGEAGARLLEQALQRTTTMISSLIQIMRRARMDDWEQALISRAVRTLDEKHRRQRGEPPLLNDLAALLREPTQELLRATLADDVDEYRQTTKPLSRSLEALLEGPLGRTFGGQTSERIRTDAPGVCVDVSAVAKQSDDVMAAIMLATWSEGFASVEAANALSDAGLAAQRNFLVVMDEMWRPLRIEGAGLVDKMDGITRLNRAEGVGNIYIAHTPKDQESMTSRADAMKARGFTERAGIVVAAGLSIDDLQSLSKVKPMSDVEIDTVARWNTPPGWRQKMVTDLRTGKRRPAPPPGCGKVLIKLGDRAGIQTQVKLTQAELDMHDTNARWLAEQIV
ncbi:MAG: ATP/GTP-binding protein [Acidimicrobiales bacterium]|nr:MAG: ATP/GTP-binding protein [Acidimicrobiales bacterium]